MRCGPDGARAVLLAVALALCSTLVAAVPPLRMAIDNATQMPMARIEGWRIVGGMNHELGRLLAERMGRDIEYRALPRKRLVEVLAANEVDMVCTYQPAWLPLTGLRWSRPFFPQSEVVVARRDAPPLQRLADLDNQPLGTVQGFVYVELERELRSGLRREDAPSAEANLRKLAARRLQYAVVDLRLLRHLQRTAVFSTPLHPPLLVAEQRTRCALSPGARIDLVTLERAISAAERDGSLAALYRRYD